MMGARSKIEWTGATWTPIRARNRATGKVGWHCAHVSPGCENCYAERLNMIRGTGIPFKPGREKDIEIFLDEKMLLAPLRWRAPRMVFVTSMTDLFADFVPDEWIDKVFAVMALSPQHIFQVLTKRAKGMREWVSNPETPFRVAQAIDAMNGADDAAWPLPGVWLGVSAEDWARADERIPDLLLTPAAVRFVSAEPLLGPIDFARIDGHGPNRGPARENGSVINALTGKRWDWPSFAPATWEARLDWIIVGGESGSHARPTQIAWARSIVAQCRAAGVECFVKQLGANPICEDGTFLSLRDRKGADMSEWPSDLCVRETPDGA